MFVQILYEVNICMAESLDINKNAELHQDVFTQHSTNKRETVQRNRVWLTEEMDGIGMIHMFVRV